MRIRVDIGCGLPWPWPELGIPYEPAIAEFRPRPWPNHADIDPDSSLHCGLLSAHRCNRWSIIAARMVLATALKTWRTTVDKLKKDVPKLPAPPVQPCMNASRSRPHKSGVQAYHKVACKRDARSGALVGRPTTREYWAKVKDEYDNLEESERAAYEERVDLEKTSAVSRCRLAKVQVSQVRWAVRHPGTSCA